MNSQATTISRELRTPRSVVEALSRRVIGQESVKRALAIAFFNQQRRRQLSSEWQASIYPKNLLIKGPTGSGKSLVVKTFAELNESPFVKVEATKFTEVGYVGRDVESMVRDLVEVSIKMERAKAMKAVQESSLHTAQERILDILLPPARSPFDRDGSSDEAETSARQLFRVKLQKGELDDKEIDVDISAPTSFEIMAPPGMEDMTNQLQNLMKGLNTERKKTHRMKIKAALQALKEEAARQALNEEEIKTLGLQNAEQNGIIFIDEIDKISSYGNMGGASVSREGVQRDLLPIIEGCSVSTKYGLIQTNHILFITAGAFQLTKPSDLIPELQGRLPIRVELESLTREDFVKILNETDMSLVSQYQVLLNTEEVRLKFESSGIERIAELAFEQNEHMENIGARRLHTVLDRAMENLSFDASDYKGQEVIIDRAYVDKQFQNWNRAEDLSSYLL